MADNSVVIRRGHYSDLSSVMEIWYANETADDPQPHARSALLPEYPHLLDTGELWIAEVAGVAVGFAGVIKRGNTAFLTDLFVDPQHQSSGLGMQLLHAAFEQYTEEIRFTVSSSDPRALALYIRAGMQPCWPNFLLRAHNLRAAAFDKPSLVITAATVDDPELWAWDAMISGRERQQDLAFWVEREGGEPLWIMHGAERVGYAIVRLRGGTIWQPHAARIGPMGVRSPRYAAAACAAVVQWAAERAKSTSIDLLGPHPGLAVLLEVGFRITYVETFMLVGDQPFFDPSCYNGSGGALF